MKPHKYRISEAAVGKILTRVMEMTRSSEISPEQFHDTMFATLNYIESEEEPSGTSKINPQKWHIIKEQIDKSARRSKSARERAIRRRQSISATASNLAPQPDVSSPLPGPYQLIPSGISPSPSSGLDSSAAKAERERLESLSREYDKVCKMSYW
ncbi:MAG: hypothetical protein K2J65_00245 [Duncaniella sp.]|nr:hypothetical protein [Duncaniella sp.]